jgi:hypothetical protein
MNPSNQPVFVQALPITSINQRLNPAPLPSQPSQPFRPSQRSRRVLPKGPGFLETLFGFGSGGGRPFPKRQVQKPAPNRQAFLPNQNQNQMQNQNRNANLFVQPFPPNLANGVNVLPNPVIINQIPNPALSQIPYQNRISTGVQPRIVPTNPTILPNAQIQTRLQPTIVPTISNGETPELNQVRLQCQANLDKVNGELNDWKRRNEATDIKKSAEITELKKKLDELQMQLTILNQNDTNEISKLQVNLDREIRNKNDDLDKKKAELYSLTQKLTEETARFKTEQDSKKATENKLNVKENEVSEKVKKLNLLETDLKNRIQEYQKLEQNLKDCKMQKQISDNNHAIEKEKLTKETNLIKTSLDALKKTEENQNKKFQKEKEDLAACTKNVEQLTTQNKGLYETHAKTQGNTSTIIETLNKEIATLQRQVANLNTKTPLTEGAAEGNGNELKRTRLQTLHNQTLKSFGTHAKKDVARYLPYSNEKSEKQNKKFSIELNTEEIWKRQKKIIDDEQGTNFFNLTLEKLDIYFGPNIENKASKIACEGCVRAIYKPHVLHHVFLELEVKENKVSFGDDDEQKAAYFFDRIRDVIDISMEKQLIVMPFRVFGLNLNANEPITFVLFIHSKNHTLELFSPIVRDDSGNFRSGVKIENWEIPLNTFLRDDIFNKKIETKKSWTITKTANLHHYVGPVDATNVLHKPSIYSVLWCSIFTDLKIYNFKLANDSRKPVEILKTLIAIPSGEKHVFLEKYVPLFQWDATVEMIEAGQKKEQTEGKPKDPLCYETFLDILKNDEFDLGFKVFPHTINIIKSQNKEWKKWKLTHKNPTKEEIIAEKIWLGSEATQRETAKKYFDIPFGENDRKYDLRTLTEEKKQIDKLEYEVGTPSILWRCPSRWSTPAVLCGGVPETTINQQQLRLALTTVLMQTKKTVTSTTRKQFENFRLRRHTDFIQFLQDYNLIGAQGLRPAQGNKPGRGDNFKHWVQVIADFPDWIKHVTLENWSSVSTAKTDFNFSEVSGAQESREQQDQVLVKAFPGPSSILYKFALVTEALLHKYFQGGRRWKPVTDFTAWKIMFGLTEDDMKSLPHATNLNDVLGYALDFEYPATPLQNAVAAEIQFRVAMFFCGTLHGRANCPRLTRN